MNTCFNKTDFIFFIFKKTYISLLKAA